MREEDVEARLHQLGARDVVDVEGEDRVFTEFVDRVGDIHRFVASHPERFGDVPPRTLDPDGIAATAWEMYTVRDRAEEVFNVLA